MCKLCERDKPKADYFLHTEWTEVMNDRLAVLEKDHILAQALEERLEPLERLLMPLLDNDTDTIEEVLKRVLKNHREVQKIIPMVQQYQQYLDILIKNGIGKHNEDSVDTLKRIVKDHQAMQKLRTFPSIAVWDNKGNRYDILIGIPPQFHKDIASAILAEGK